MAGDEMRAPEGAPHGTGAALRRLAGVVDAGAKEQPPPASAPVAPPAFVLAEESPGGDPYEEALFAPSDRPDEPITAGVPFGPGPSFSRLPVETERAFAVRVARILEDSPGADALRPYIDKLLAGG